MNTEDFPSEILLAWHSDEEHRITCRGREYTLSEFPSVWYRRPVAPRIGSVRPDVAEWVLRESEEALSGLWRGHDALWVNHPDDNRRAEFKQGQLLRASTLGLEVPRTLVTNSGIRARAFADTIGREAISKPLRLGRLLHRGEEKLFMTSLVGAEQLAALGEGGETYMLQELVAKRFDIRVTVIGQQCFAVEIASQEDLASRIDWRHGGTALRHTNHRLGVETEERCLELCRSYGLQFGAIDLALRPDGGYTFFEVNPNGQWAWIEQLTGQPLSAALADLLMSPC